MFSHFFLKLTYFKHLIAVLFSETQFRRCKWKGLSKEIIQNLNMPYSGNFYVNDDIKFKFPI
jgi:hypothetical protein